MKNKTSLLNKITSILLCIIILLGMIPIGVYAYPGDGNQPGLTSNCQYKIDGQTVLGFVTSGGGDITRSKGSDDNDTQQYTAIANSDWIFSHWMTYYEGSSVKEDNPKFGYGLLHDYYFSKPGDTESQYVKTNTTIQINNEWDATGTYYLYAIFRPKITISVDVESNVSVRCINAVDGMFETSENSGFFEDFVYYNGTTDVHAGIKDRIPEKIYINGNETSNYHYSESYFNNNGGFIGGYIELDSFVLTRPTTITIKTREKITNVKFDNNGGSGEMEAQQFSKGKEQTLSANTFTKKQYTFIGWNTEANGSGTSYTDKQSITFTPTKDGESITLYAQWEKLPTANYTAPTAKEITYDGSLQELISKGSTTEGIMMYSLEANGTYLEEIPAKTNAGNYKVWYYVKGDSNHSDSPKAFIDVRIEKANPVIGTVSAGIVNNTTDISAIVLERANKTIEGNLLVESNQTLSLGDNEICYIFIPNDTENYNKIKGNVTVTVKDTISPTGTVTLSDAKTIWDKVLETITFGQYFNSDQKVVVKATDSFSGIERVEYYETDDILDLDAIKALPNEEWNKMDDSIVVTAEDAKQFIYYIRITDKSGNIGYISTDGAEFDTTSPEINGVNDGNTYYTSQKINVADKNLDTVIMNGKTDTDTIILDGNKEEIHTIVATDKAGNSTTVTVKMAKLEDITNVTSDNVTLEDKEKLENVKKQLEEELKENADIFAEEEKNAIEDKIKDIDKALKVIYDAIKAAEEAGRNNPQTGDNIVLFVLIFAISVIGIVTTTKMNKKLKNRNLKNP